MSVNWAADPTLLDELLALLAPHRLRTVTDVVEE